MYIKTSIHQELTRKNRELTLLTSVHFTGYARIRSRVTRSVPESYHRCTTIFSGSTRGRCLASRPEYSASLTSSSNQCLYKDTSGNPWLCHFPGSVPGRGWILHTRNVTILEVYIYMRVVEVKIRNP